MLEQRAGAGGRGAGIAALALVFAALSAICLSGSGVAVAATEVAGPTGAPPSPDSRPYASLPQLGPAPVRCFPYGSSDNICNGPSWPYPPNANFLYATYYGTVYVSPHVVGVGQDITANAVGDLGGRPTWSTPPGPIVAGCSDQKSDAAGKVIRAADDFCTWKATAASSYPPDPKAPGGGYEAYGMSFCGFNGCAQSQDFYYVLAKKRAISGLVTTTGTNAKTGQLEILPVPDAHVKVSGTQSGSATTDREGFYDVLVDPGRYTVSVDSIAGHATSNNVAPGSCSPGGTSAGDCQVSTLGEDATANFTACTGSGTLQGRRLQDAAAAGAAAKSSFSCPLTVVVKPLEQGNPAGLTDDNTNPTFLGGANGVCSSGCTDVLVTVLDHNKPVNGALVTATVTTPITTGIAPYPAGVHPDGNYLCAGGAPTNCSTGALTGLTTNSKGQVALVYWAPGLVKSETAKISVHAYEGCAATAACPFKLRGGHNSATIKVIAKPLVNETAMLSEEQISELESFAGAHPVAFFLTKEGAETALTTYFEYWENEAAAHAVEAGGVLVEAAHMALELREQDGVMGMFGELFGIPPNGLGANSAATHVGYMPTQSFTDAFAGTGVVLGIGPKGLLYNFGQALGGFDKLHQINSPQALQLVIYEISFCSQGQDCSAYGASTQSYLFIQLFSHSATAIGKNGFTGSFSAPYNARAWMFALPATSLAK